MKGAGLTVGGFYAHFDSKEALFLQVMRQSLRSSWTRLLLQPRDAADPDPLRALIDHYLSTQHRDAEAEGCPLPMTAAEVIREGEPYRAVLADELGFLVDSLAALLGGTPQDRRRALALIALLYGALTLSRAVRDTPLSAELLDAARTLALDTLPPKRGSGGASPSRRRYTKP
jgi:TetR/AcrR family transcriptional repressor of nem operon